eukprot:CAMPEP_0198717762 /NCGR_PEP_ID=MMETSP1471-20131121/46376_1 /TAXON_ID=41880 /ORGANISM="Pycnococcus provasolii, Strain RCC733" /LENGTH=65 /DNA_ID=CAMNT_0044478377 /DNA_START=122 /DNA_END=316 /DNA_ORIENTATION=+
MKEVAASSDIRASCSRSILYRPAVTCAVTDRSLNLSTSLSASGTAPELLAAPPYAVAPNASGGAA